MRSFNLLVNAQRPSDVMASAGIKLDSSIFTNPAKPVVFSEVLASMLNYGESGTIFFAARFHIETGGQFFNVRLCCSGAGR